MKKYQPRNVLFIAEYQEYILLRAYYKQAKCTKENEDSQRHLLIWQLLLSIGWRQFRRSCGQIISRSWKGAQETKQQLQALSGRRIPLAGATGASIQQEPTPQARTESLPTGPIASYSVQFVQHAPEPVITPNKVRTEHYPHCDRQPSQGFALKKGTGKRVTFTAAQKEVMIEFYERQATQGIRANPKDAIEVMRQRGLDPLKETQIRGWWSAYHQKRKNAVNNFAEEVNSLSNSRNQVNAIEEQTSGSTPNQPVSQQPSGPNQPVSQQPSGLNQPVSQQSSGPNQPVSQQPSGPDLPVSQQPSGPNEPVSQQPNGPNQPVSQQPSGPNQPVSQQTVGNHLSQQTNGGHQPQPTAYLLGTNSTHTPCIVEWRFPRDLSQSTIYDRMGSNACTFIALHFGHLYFSCGLQPPIINSHLQNNWKVALIDAIISGNDIHDDIFEGDAINVSVDEAVQIAGEECHVDKICQQYDIIGSNRLGQLINVFKTLAVGQPHSCHIVITGDRSMLFIVNQDKSPMIVDSHEHRGTGALIAYAPVGQVDSLALWFTRMHSATWDTEIGLTSLVSVSYVL